MTSRRNFSMLAVAAMAASSFLIPQTAQAHPARQGHASAPPSAAQRAPVSAQLLGGPGVWTKFSSGTVGALAQLGLVRTSDGKLHVVWVRKNKPSDNDVRSTTFSLAGALLHNGPALSHWLSFDQTLALVPDGKGIRLVFSGGQDGNNSNKFSLGSLYTATSSNGISWTLVHGGLSSHTVFNQSVAATTKLDGTPVAAEGLNGISYFHVGVDPSIPAASVDKTFTHGSAYWIGNESLVRDKTGTVYAAWYEESNTGQGYWVRPIVPSVGAALLAPHSKDVGLADNEPRGAVALAARAGGGVYMAYCVASKTATCTHIDLWKVGSSAVRIVPGSAGNHDVRHVTIAAGPKGRIVVGWYDATKGVLRVIRTNTHATSWGVLRSIKPPVPASQIAGFNGLFLEASSGRIDVIANAQRNSTTSLYHTQVLAGLRLTASPSTVSHTHSATITFKVTDAGEAVASATVSFAGHTAHTNTQGIAKITIAKGKAGTKTATASKTGYFKATVSVKIT